jgi:hypothetical protein
MRDPMTYRSRFVGSRLFKTQSLRYHSMPVSETVNRIKLCGCMGSIRLAKRAVHCGRRIRKDARFANNYRSHSVWA